MWERLGIDASAQSERQDNTHNAKAQVVGASKPWAQLKRTSSVNRILGLSANKFRSQLTQSRESLLFVVNVTRHNSLLT
jgi:hypothetical protein